MNSQISAKYYHCTQQFEREKKKIFANTWIFAGFKHDFQKDNDFRTLKVNDIPIVVQKMKGEVKAFLNICSHRFSKIQVSEFGNRPLLCPYHGWAYNSEGIPVGIPKKPLFKKYNKKELCEMKLKEFRVERCGSLYFLTLNNKIKSLKEYLGEYYKEIEEMTNGFGKQIDVNRMKIKSNWKVIIENTMEAYHLGLVHTDTLAKLMPTTSIDNLKFSFCGPHSNYIIPLLVDENSKKLKFLHNPFSDRKWKINGFKHYLLFPNLLISSSYGTTFSVSVINPITSTETDFINNIFLCKLNSNKSFNDVKSFIDTAVDYNRKVFDEDKEACENVQDVVQYTTQPGVLSLEEKRVHEFQKEYLKFLNEF